MQIKLSGRKLDAIVHAASPIDCWIERGFWDDTGEPLNKDELFLANALIQEQSESIWFEKQIELADFIDYSA